MRISAAGVGAAARAGIGPLGRRLGLAVARAGLAAGLLVADPAVAALPPPILGPELTLDPPVLTGATGEQTETAAAWDGSRFLVAWQSGVWRNELRFARLDATLRVLDPRGIQLDDLDVGDGRVSVAAGGGVFLLAWTRAPDRVLTAVVRPEAPQPLGPPVVISAGLGDTFVRGPKVAFDGSRFWVLWSRGGQDSGVFAARVGPDGQPQDAAPVRLAAGFVDVALAARAGETLVVFVDPAVPGGGAVVGRRFGGDGASLDATARALFAPAPADSHPAVGTDGAGYLVVVSGSAEAGAPTEVRALRLGADGAPLGAPPLTLAAPGPGSLSEPSVAWDGQRFLVLWSRTGVAGAGTTPPDGIEGKSVGTDGALAPIDHGWTRLGRRPVVVGAGAAAFVLWDEIARRADNGDIEDSDVYAAPLGPPGLGPLPALVSTGTNWQSEPVVAWNGSTLFLAWEDKRHERFAGDVFGIRVDASGKPLDAQALAIAAGPGTQSAPAVAWDGQRFVVVFRQADGSLGHARVTAEGALEDPSPVPIPGTAGVAKLSDPAVCGGGPGVLVAWAQRPPGTAGARPTELRGLRLGPGASVAAGAPAVLTTTADLDGPAVVRLGCNAGGAVVVWSGVFRPGEESDLHALHLGPGALAALAPLPDAAVLRLGPRVRDEWAGVATDGSGFLVAWRGFSGAGQRTVYATRLDVDGNRLDEPALTIGRSNSGRRVTAVWDGRQYVVLAVNTAGGNPFELRGRRVSPAGRVLDAEWFVAAILSKPWGGGGAGAEGVAVAPGQAFFTYEQYPEEDGAGNPRTRGRFVSFPAAADAETDAGAGADAGVAPTPDLRPADAGDAGPTDADASGCSCRIGARAPVGIGGLLLPLLGAIVLGRRRFR